MKERIKEMYKGLVFFKKKIINTYAEWTENNSRKSAKIALVLMCVVFVETLVIIL